jgi:hypothetical protein
MGGKRRLHLFHRRALRPRKPGLPPFEHGEPAFTIKLDFMFRFRGRVILRKDNVMALKNPNSPDEQMGFGVKGDPS